MKKILTAIIIAIVIIYLIMSVVMSVSVWNGMTELITYRLPFMIVDRFSAIVTNDGNNIYSNIDDGYVGYLYGSDGDYISTVIIYNPCSNEPDDILFRVDYNHNNKTILLS